MLIAVIRSIINIGGAGELRIARTEIASLAGFEQFFLCVGGLWCVKSVWICQGNVTFLLNWTCFSLINLALDLFWRRFFSSTRAASILLTQPRRRRDCQGWPRL